MPVYTKEFIKEIDEGIERMVEVTKELGMVKIMTGAEEKVGLENFSNVVIGPISISRWIEDGDDEYIKEELKRNLLLVEEIIAEVREDVLTSVQESKKK